MWKYAAVAALSAFLSVMVFAKAGSQKLSPGSQPYTPTRIDWLATTLQASLREDALETHGYMLQITYSDSETILIYVRYTRDANRQIMNMSIDTARSVIHTTAKSYGWDDWVKIREDIEMGKNKMPSR
jgi:ABC-type proline/glycine betaine transport system substrate-binding protein